MRKFNVTGLCIPEEDYMVDISGKIEQIKNLVDGRNYFTINRARQYGKTTTLFLLEKALHDIYTVASISFEGLGEETFESQEKFCPAFLERICGALEFSGTDEEYREKWLDGTITDFKKLNRHIKKLCENKKVVLIIDEVDKTSNNRVFLQFLGMLREKFLARKTGKDYTFHSVILAGVYDIKNIKLKMMSEGSYTPTATEDKTYNSPWNIAVDFKVDMSFAPVEIATMLDEYEKDHNTGMEITEISEKIYFHTNGYPFLVSRICQHIDEELEKNWTTQGVQKAVNIIIDEENTLFDDIYKNLSNNKKLYQMLYNILIAGTSYNFKIGNPIINLADKLGIVKNKNGIVAISNQIFETIIRDYFASIDQMNTKDKAVQNVII